MPYIKAERRLLFDEHIDKIASNITSGGEINYCIYRICLEFIKKNGLTYDNSMIPFSALSAAQMELYRRVISPYEDKKIAENGDVD